MVGYTQPTRSILLSTQMYVRCRHLFYSDSRRQGESLHKVYIKYDTGIMVNKQSKRRIIKTTLSPSPSPNHCPSIRPDNLDQGSGLEMASESWENLRLSSSK